MSGEEPHVDANGDADRPAETLSDHLSFEDKVLQRLRDIDKRLHAIEAIIEGRTKVALKLIELAKTVVTWVGTTASKVCDSVTNPSRSFLAFWLITMLGIGGLSATEVFSVVDLVKGLWSTEVVAP